MNVWLPAVQPQLGDGVLLRAEHEGELVVRLLLRAHREHLHLEETNIYLSMQGIFHFSYSLYNLAPICTIRSQFWKK